jgi:hypothetical protein
VPSVASSRRIAFDTVGWASPSSRDAAAFRHDDEGPQEVPVEAARQLGQARFHAADITQRNSVISILNFEVLAFR